MNAPLRSRIQVFQPSETYAVVSRRLPHWSQAGTICFVTWQTWDSIPQHVLKIWLDHRDAWLTAHAISPTLDLWRAKLPLLDVRQRQEFQLLLSDRWNEHLDECHGECVLRRRELSQIVAESLKYFDGDRYDITDFVVMPNHVHLLATFPDESAMLKQCESWKRFTATAINRVLCRKGRFWQQEDFDHLVRSVEQFDYFRGYIAENPRRARLQPGEYVHFSKPL